MPGENGNNVMSTTPLIVQGIVNADGTLELEGKVSLPPGRVQVTVQPLPDLPADDPFWQQMQAIWDAQKARGHSPRSVAEVETERQAIRSEWEKRMKDVEHIQEQGRSYGERDHSHDKTHDRCGYFGEIAQS
jgi:hypothetical protein